MSTTPNALELADKLDDGQCSLAKVMAPAAAELRRQHGEIEGLRAQVEAMVSAVAFDRLNALNESNAERILELEAKAEALTDGIIAKEAALIEWFDKTDWLGKSIVPSELGKHRADILRERIEALGKPQEPFVWLVCSVNKDGSLSLEHTAQWREAAHEHINDAISIHEIEGASDWVVRPAYLAPQPLTRPAVPEGWVPCVLSFDGEETEEVAYGPKVMMDRLAKWLTRHFERTIAERERDAEVKKSLVPDLMSIINTLAGNEAKRSPLAAAPQPEAAQPEPVTTAPCKGMNCGCTDGLSHSMECQAEHTAAIAGGRFVKDAAPQAVGDA